MKFSEEALRKMRESKLGPKNPNYGKFGKDHPAYGAWTQEKKEYHSKVMKRVMARFKGKPGRKQSEETKRKIGFANQGKSHKNKGGKVMYIITHPNGREEKIFGMRAFCRENGLNSSLMSRVVNGTYTHHKGYKARYAYNQV